MDKNTVLLKKIYYAFNKRDIDAALAIIHPNVMWSNGLGGGYIEGREGLREYWRRQWEVLNSDVEPVSISTSGKGRIVANVRHVVRDLHENIIEDEMLQHTYIIEDNLIKHMDVAKLPLAV
ncbi:MAG TPA: nuclear transport factor 2 family protein [Chitinophagaceae bacterium]|nr:nuclear transport factor 2 family protein [Chitinophagaceae bacterium]